MPHKDNHPEETPPPPQAKRTGRESADPRSQPGEFADDMRTNRFEDVPEPGVDEEK